MERLKQSGGTVINAVAKAMPQFITGSADLFGSTKNYIKDGGDFSKSNPLGRNVTIEEVGNTAAFLLSDLASGITGEITYVDGGYSINALNDPEEEE